LEKVDIAYTEEVAGLTPIHKTQNTNRKGSSTETALLELVGRAEKALQQNEIHGD